MDVGIGAVRGSWSAAGGEQASRPEPRSREGAAFGLPWTNVLVVKTGASLSVPATARQLTRTALAGWLLSALISDAELICSELVSNAVQATAALPEPRPVGFRLLANAGQLVIEAWDCHPGQPVRQVADDIAEHGRGLNIVHGLSNRWGTRRVSRQLKAVWAELLIPR